MNELKVDNGINGNITIPMKKGTGYFIRTVTFFYTGIYQGTQGGFIELSKASWIADTGSLSDAMATGIHNCRKSETEKYPGSIFINVDAITDFLQYSHETHFTKTDES